MLTKDAYLYTLDPLHGNRNRFIEDTVFGEIDKYTDGNVGHKFESTVVFTFR